MKTVITFIFVLFWGVAAQAHFIVETQNREIHVLQTEEGATRVILRFPLTLAYANELSQRAPNAAFTAPFMQQELVRGRPFYRLGNIAHDAAFTKFLLRDYRFSINGHLLTPEQAEIVVFDTHGQGENPVQPAGGLLASLDVLAQHASNPPSHPYISDVLVVVSFFLNGVAANDPLKIELLSAPFYIPKGMVFETRITDHRVGTPKLLTQAGATMDPVTLTGSALVSFVHFVKQGVEHILSGYDHLLFVLCLVVAAAANLRRLAWAVTGFTLGHSVTLAAGVFGVVPQGAWFIPLVEFLVAGSILLMALLILTRRVGQQGFWLALAIGLLHGFGFSFMLSGLLGGTGSALVAALAGFNIGVELGQLAIVIAVVIILWLAAHLSGLLHTTLRYGIAAAACIIAMFMMVERYGILRVSFEQIDPI